MIPWGPRVFLFSQILALVQVQSCPVLYPSIYIPMTNLCWCITKTNTILQSNYPPIKKINKQTNLNLNQASKYNLKFMGKFMGFPCGLVGKESACNAGDLGSIPGLGRSPGEGKGYPFQYSGLEHSMDCIVLGVAKSQTWLSHFHFHLWEIPFQTYQTIKLDKGDLSKPAEDWEDVQLWSLSHSAGRHANWPVQFEFDDS